MSSRSWTMAGFREDAFDRVFATLQASAKVYSIKAPLLPSICLLPSFFSQPRSEIAFNSSLTHLSPLRPTRATCPRTACSPPASSSRCSPIPLTLPRAIPVPPCLPSLHNVLRHGIVGFSQSRGDTLPQRPTPSSTGWTANSNIPDWQRWPLTCSTSRRWQPSVREYFPLLAAWSRHDGHGSGLTCYRNIFHPLSREHLSE